MISVVDNNTGLTFAFETHELKEKFFDLWDEYQQGDNKPDLQLTPTARRSNNGR